LIKIEEAGIKVHLKEQAHDFGVNCIDTLIVDDGFLVVTGGDDQHIRAAFYSEEGVVMAV